MATFTSEEWTSNFMGKGFKFSLKPDSKPKAIDLHPLDDTDKTWPGIYKLEGNKLTICFRQPVKQERPSTFEYDRTPDSYTVLVVLKRETD